MEIFTILSMVVVSFVIGIIVTLSIQYYVLYYYFKKSPLVKTPEPVNSVDYSLPESLKKHLETEDINDKSYTSSLPISLVLQFLFHELRHSESIKRWLYKKLSLEFDELLTKTTIGKFFDTINIKDMNLGSQFPHIKDITIEEVKLDKKEGHIDTVSLCLNLEYTGNFLLSIDGKMKFAKTAYLSITVKKICGLARLQFTRYPYTHWSFSFYNEPIMELAVESHFQGRQLQSNITNLIVNQIKKAIRRKHTLPNYKIRYKPFFVKTDPSQLDIEDNEILPQGQLDIQCIEITRLEIPTNIQNIYCTFCIDAIPWICLYQHEDKINIILEITMVKLRQIQLGVIFRQEQNLVVVIDSVSPHSCASKAGLKSGDIVLAIDNRPVTTVPQVAKLIKSISSTNITLRLERVCDSYIIKNKPSSCCINDNNHSGGGGGGDDFDLNQTEQDSFVVVDKKETTPPLITTTTTTTTTPELTKKSKCLTNLEKFKSPDKMQKMITTNENMSKFAQTIGNFTLRKRKTPVTGDNSTKNTPNSSGPGTPQHTVVKQPQQQQQITVPTTNLSAKKHSISELPEIIRTDFENVYTDIINNVIEVVRSKESSPNPVLEFNEDFQFHLKDGSKYLNINVWGQSLDNDKDILLGYINIPLSHILNECCNSVLGHYMRSYSFLPPTYTQPNSQTHPLMSHSGFEHVFCYGDILLSFIWNHDDDNVELKRKMSTIVTDSKDEETVVNTTIKHDFIRTQFHRTIHCDFCSKKIWLKDAVQCRGCGLCCHKKCIVKCQMSTGCVPVESKTVIETTAQQQQQPEITMTDVDDDTTTTTTTTATTNDTNSENINLKRVNSVNNLAIPGSHSSTNLSKSLPPSPQRTPSRKQSISNINPFLLCPTILNDIQNITPIEASDSIHHLLEQVMLCPQDESLMDVAKETGKQMYQNMPHEERVEKINLIMAELKKSLDSVTLEHMELSKQMNVEESETEKTKLAFLMGQADAKVHGLSVLMLHYCSSLQHTQEKIV